MKKKKGILIQKKVTATYILKSLRKDLKNELSNLWLYNE